MGRQTQQIDPAAVKCCIREFDLKLAELARRYGISVVVTALGEIVGCESWVEEEHEESGSPRPLPRRAVNQ